MTMSQSKIYQSNLFTIIIIYFICYYFMNIEQKTVVLRIALMKFSLLPRGLKHTLIYFFLRKPGGFQWSTLAWGDLKPSYSCVNLSRLSIASVDGMQYLNEVVFNALVGFSLLDKYLTFGREQPEVAGSHIRRVKSLAYHRSKKSLNQVRGMCWSIDVP